MLHTYYTHSCIYNVSELTIMGDLIVSKQYEYCNNELITQYHTIAYILLLSQ